MPFINERTEQAVSLLADDHSELDRLIGDSIAALEKEDKLKAFERLDLLWAQLAVHIRAEHLCVFPSILNAPRENFTGRDGDAEYQEAQSAINQLRLDHEFFMSELGAAVNTIRNRETPSEHEAISKQLQDVRRSIVKIQSRLDQHNQLEENHVYKWVNVLLSDAERLALAARIRHELENTPPRFQPA
jgi:iron-sulfur cluster repair protein YtfE (RIC family)